MEKTIDFICETCGDPVSLFAVHTESTSTQSSGKAAIPNPMIKKSGYSRYVDHHDHTLNIQLDDTGRITKIISIPKLNSVLDRLVSNNVNLSRIVNDYLREQNLAHPQTILFLSDSRHFATFLSNKVASYILSQEPVAIEKSDDELHVEFDQINFILSSSIDHLQYAHQKYKKFSLTGHKLLQVKSIIIDLTSFDEDNILSVIEEKNLKFDNTQSFILAFNSLQKETVPLHLRDYLEDKFAITRLDMLNFNKLDGLKTISLQAYFNLVDDEFDIRDDFEKSTIM